MGIFAKKTMAGYRPVPQTEATHYIADLSEYTQIQQDLRQLRAQLQDALDGASGQMNEIKKAESEQLAAIRNEYQNQFCILEKRNQELELGIESRQKEIDDLKRLNSNLLRILRDRANASRNIVPKKAHDGYIITSCRQYRDYKELHHSWEDYQKQPAVYRKKHRYISVEKIPVKAWKVTIQTPYPIGIPVSQVENQILTELQTGIMKEMGCNAIEPNGSYPLGPSSSSVVYKWEYAADLRSGLWTIDLYMTGQPCIPLNRMPRNPSVIKRKEKSNEKEIRSLRRTCQSQASASYRTIPCNSSGILFDAYREYSISFDRDMLESRMASLCRLCAYSRHLLCFRQQACLPGL